MVREYIKVMETAPDFEASDLSQQYKLLAKYNNVVLAGRELSNGSFEFITLRQNNRVDIEKCFGNNYAGAKEDFAVRTGLINEDKIFSNVEYDDIYHCISEILGSDYELSDEHIERLQRIKTKIEKVTDNSALFNTSQNNEQKLSIKVKREVTALKSISISKDGIIECYGNRAGYMQNHVAVVDEIFRRAEVEQ